MNCIYIYEYFIFIFNALYTWRKLYIGTGVDLTIPHVLIVVVRIYAPRAEGDSTDVKAVALHSVYHGLKLN